MHGGYQYSEAIVITKTGPELLCHTPRILYLSDTNYVFNKQLNSSQYKTILNKYQVNYKNPVNYKNGKNKVILETNL